MKPTAKPVTVRPLQAAPASDMPALRRRGGGMLALEPRYMFDGAAPGQLAEATTLALDRVQQYLDRTSNAELADTFNGAAGSGPATSAWLEAADALRTSLRPHLAGLQVQTVDNQTLRGAWGAFTAHGPDGQPVIYLNADWLARGADTEDIARVLIEEMGHAIDVRLNGPADSVGDEGELFATRVLATGTVGAEYRDMLRAQEDHQVITVNGQEVQVELATLNFTNAYAIYTSAVSGNAFPADKEQNRHHFDPTLLGVARIADGTNGQSFSGNDVSVELTINGVTHYGWISRPIKDQGIVRGFYFWKDAQFGSLSAAQTDGNQDGDGTPADNSGFILVVDQTWFTNVALVTGTSYKFVGSSSDRVDTALNSVLPTNSAPTPANDTRTVAEDSGASSGNVLTNDTDPNNDTLTVTQFVIGGTTYSGAQLGQTQTIAGVGTFSMTAAGAYTFTPAANYNGPVPAITYTVSDGVSPTPATATAVLSITVTPVNDPPTSTNDTASTPENTPLVLTPNEFGTYADPDSDPLAKVIITTLPSAGTLQYWTGSTWASVTTNQEFTRGDLLAGKLRFSPATDANGANYATVGFKVNDGTVDSTAAYSLVISVTTVNSAPVANADNADGSDYAQEVGATEAGFNQTGNVLLNDTDPDGAITRGTTHWVQSATSAALTTNVSVTQASTSTSSPASVTGLYGTLKLGGDGSYIYEIANSLAAVQALRTTSNTLTEYFTYTMRDSAGLTSTSTLRVVIKGANDAPVAVIDRNAVQEAASSTVTSGVTNYGTATGNVLTNDTDVDAGDSLSVLGSYAAATGSSNGTTTVTLTGSGLSSINANDYVYIHGATPQLLTVGGVAVRVFTSNNGSITLDNNNALRVNDQNKVFATGDSVGFFNTASYSGSGNYKTATYSGSSVAASTTISVSGITGAISQGMSVTNGTDTRTVSSVTYGAGGAITSVTLNSSVTWQSASLTFSASAGTTLTGRYGRVSIAADGQYTYYLTSNALNSGESYTESFSYTAKDTSNAQSASFLYIRIDGTTGASTVSQSVSTPEDTAISGTAGTGGTGVLAGATNLTTVVDFSWGSETKSAGQTITISGVGTLTIGSTGTYTFTPATDYTGPVPDAVFNANNSAAASNTSYTGSGRLSLAITPVNDAPTASNDAVTTPEDTAVILGVTDFGTYADVEGSALSAVKITTLPTKGTLSFYNGSSWVAVTLDQSITVASLNAGFLRYTPVADESGTGYTTIGFKVNDGTDLSSSAYTLTVNVTPVNDVPVNTVPGAQTVAENGTLSVSGLSVNDVDGATDIASVTVSVTNGTLAATVSGSGAISNSGTATVTLTGTKTELDAMLATLQYSPTAGYAGSDAIRIYTVDAAGDSDTDYVPITVSSDNRALTVTGTVVNEASPYVRFNVDGEPGQRVRLVLSETGSGAPDATLGADFLPNLQYYNGSAWVDYTGGFVTIPSTLNGVSNTSGLLLVRTAVLQDSTFETTTSTYETLRLTAYNAVGGSGSATSQIRDDGQGAIYLATNNTVSTPNVTGDSGYPSFLDDDRPVTVNNLSVNEGSDWAIFTVTGSVGQVVSMALTNGTATIENGDGSLSATGNEDYGRSLQIWDPTANSSAGGWVAYTANSNFTFTDATTYVRTAINPDTVFEGQHNFFLGVTRKAPGDTVYGTGNIYDDGTGVKYDGTFSGGANGTPVTSTSSLDDDRTVSVDSPTANEASNYMVFTVTGNSGQVAELQLVNESVGGTVTGKADVAAQTLQVWDGRAWVDYSANNLPTFDGNHKIFVRVTITSEQESAYEGSETYLIQARLPGAASWTSGTGTIVDDGTSVIYPGTFTSGAVNTTTTGIEDDRALTVNTPTVNEGSPYTVFEVTGIAGLTAELSLANASGAVSGQADMRVSGTLPTIQVLSGGLWVNYNPSSLPVIPVSGPLYVRVSNTGEQESALDGPETFKLVAKTSTGLFSNGGTATIVDDGTGSYFDTNNTTGASSVPSGVSLDDDRTLTVDSPTVNEASNDVVFTITGDTGQAVTLALVNESVGGTVAGKANVSVAQTLRVWSGSAWVDYDSSNPPTFNANGKVFVKVSITSEQEAAYEGGETFKLNATLANRATPVSGTATIVDDGTGVIYPGTFTGSTVNTTATGIEDDRVLVVNAPTVNEGSPFVVFEVTGVAGQSATLSLTNASGGVSGRADLRTSGTLPTLQVLSGGVWVNYNPSSLPTIPGSGPLYVRVSISAEQETALDGPETFKLVAANSTGVVSTGGTATIVDDGTGSYFATNNTTGTSAVPSGVTLDDDRMLSVDNLTVNEASDYAVFTVTGNVGAGVTLALVNESSGGTVAGKANVASQTLRVWNGSAWTPYNANNPPVFDANGKVFVRVDITSEQDLPYEGAETFKLTASLVSGSGSAQGTATIVDDGTGVIYPGTFTSGAVNTTTTGREDDRALTVSNPTVNEGSPFAVFEVSGVVGQSLTLALADASGGQSRADLRTQGQLPTLQVYVSGQWVDYNPTSPPTIPAGGKLLVRVAIDAEQERSLDGPETFRLVATTSSGRASTGGTATIVDDGTGSYFAADNTTGVSRVPDGQVLDDDRPRSLPPPPAAPRNAPPTATPVVLVAEVPQPPSAPPFNSTLAVPSRAAPPPEAAARPTTAPDVAAPPPDALTSRAGFPVVVNGSAPPGLTVFRGITDQFVEQGAGTKVSLPFDAFVHSKQDAVIRLDAKNADDSPLPPWVRFDATSGTFDVAPPPGFQGRLDIKVNARDDDGREATTIFRMFVGEPQRPQSRESFSDKLRMAARKQLLMVRSADGALTDAGGPALPAVWLDLEATEAPLEALETISEPAGRAKPAVPARAG